MTQTQLRMLLCVFQVAFLTAGIYFYVFWKKLDHKPYFEQLAFIYFLILGFTEFLVAIILFILIRTQAQINTFGQIARHIRSNCYKEYYALIIINLMFLITFNVISIIDPDSVSFNTLDSIHFVAAYYIQSLLFYFFSNDLLQRRVLVPNETIFEREGIFRCAYEVLYYVICLFIVLTYFLVTHFQLLEQPQQTLCQLLIFSLLYLFYSVTKLGILIKIFLIITLLRMFYSAAASLGDLTEDWQKGVQITLLVISGIFIIRVFQQTILGFYLAVQQYLNQNQNQPPDILSALNLLPERDPYRRNLPQVISEEQIQALPVHKFKLENEFVCSICDMNLIKDELVTKLTCNHIFHPECLKPWLRLKNSCPNCRQKVVGQLQNNQVIFFQEIQQLNIVNHQQQNEHNQNLQQEINQQPSQAIQN